MGRRRAKSLSVASSMTVCSWRREGSDRDDAVEALVAASQVSVQARFREDATAVILMFYNMQ